MVVYTGLLKLLRGPAMETQVAAVLGHEIAHVVARHSVQILTLCTCMPATAAILFMHMHLPACDAMGSSSLCCHAHRACSLALHVGHRAKRTAHKGARA